MVHRPDVTRAISRSRLCEIGGVNRQTRDKWVARGLLPDNAPCGELDLIALVVLNALYGTIKKGHVPIAWRQIESDLRQSVPAGGLKLVWDIQARKAALASDDASVVELVRHGGPVHVIDLAERIDAVRTAFRNELSAGPSHPIRKRSRTARKSAGRLRTS
jgi:hypothetical protein